MELTLQLARLLDVPNKELINIRRGAILHDIGKMAFPDYLLQKTGKLTADEKEIIQQHPETALRILEGIPFLEKALDIPYCHHEYWNGNGYPRGLKEREIPLAARIFALADVWDALRTDRPYRPSWSKKKVVAHISEQSGRQFDPEIAKVFLEMVKHSEI